ncbi:MAG TPA: AAA family ATPase, partial [Dehalococcoidia bacterium]|nr:AAA family ATPase [Dehalococcoidia bacterium]
MKLIEATVYNYKSIGHETVLTIEPEITCLAGKSESGKTNMLEAIFRALTPGPSKEDETCSWLDDPGAHTAIASLSFRLSEEDLDSIGNPVIANNVVRLTKTWGGDTLLDTGLPRRLERRLT